MNQSTPEAGTSGGLAVVTAIAMGCMGIASGVDYARARSEMPRQNASFKRTAQSG